MKKLIEQLDEWLAGYANMRGLEEPMKTFGKQEFREYVRSLNANTAEDGLSRYQIAREVWRKYKQFYGKALRKVRSTEAMNNIMSFGDWLDKQEDA